MKLKKGLAVLMSASTILSVMPMNTWAYMPKNHSVIAEKTRVVHTGSAKTDENYAKIQNLSLHVIYPETKTITVNERSSSVRIFLFGDIVRCPNSFYMMEQLIEQVDGTGTEIYFLDIKDRSAEEIMAKNEELPKDDSYFLCEDKDKRYNRVMWDLIGSGKGSIIMPVIFIVGRENETLYLNSFPSSAKYSSYTEELKNIILNAYPEESQDNASNSTETASSGEIKGNWALNGDGQWTFTDENGNMAVGWCLIDGSYYYFSEESDAHRGRLYVNEQTPDGYFVDADGKWIQ